MRNAAQIPICHLNFNEDANNPERSRLEHNLQALKDKSTKANLINELHVLHRQHD